MAWPGTTNYRAMKTAKLIERYRPTLKDEMENHYSTGRRWSRISKAWIFEKHWNDQEEIAMLREELDEVKAQAFQLLAENARLKKQLAA